MVLPPDIQALMANSKNVRNVCVVAHADHGKSTITDCLLSACGLAANASGDVRATDTREDEAQRGISIKSTAATISYDFVGRRTTTDDGRYLVNLVDCPGHVDFSGEVTAALRVTDGALVVVDAVDGVRVQTEAVLRQALANRLKPVLVINKLDRLFLQKQLDAEGTYNALLRVVESVNAIISKYCEDTLGDWKVSPAAGTVVFAAGRQGWGFTLEDFTAYHARLCNAPIDEVKRTERLWGENFVDLASKSWTSHRTKSSTCFRGFEHFVYIPLKSMLDACAREDKAEVSRMLKKVGHELKPEALESSGKDFIKHAMQVWLPAGDALLKMLVLHTPSPAVAQPYRVDCLYGGPVDDHYARAMKTCDVDGPTIIYIYKLLPASDQPGRFHALGRIFSGKVAPGDKVLIRTTEDSISGSKETAFTKSVQRVGMFTMKSFDAVDWVPCGNTVVLSGIDGVISKSATVTGHKEAAAYTFKKMEFSVGALLQVALGCSDVSKLRKGMEMLAKSDPLVQCTLNESGDYILAVGGELHLEVCLKDLREFMSGLELSVGEPVVPYRETVAVKSSCTAMSKSPNKHNRLYMEASPMDVALMTAVEYVRSSDITTEILQQLGMDLSEANKVWCFGPATTSLNMLVNSCKGAYYTKEIKDSVVRAFKEVSKGGALAGEPLRGVRFDLSCAVLHSDAVHRGGGQIISPAIRAMEAAQMAASPRLMEPMYVVEVQAPPQATGAVEKVLRSRRSKVLEAQYSYDVESMSTFVALLPVAESFGLIEALRVASSGEASVHMEFKGWQLMDSDPLEQGSAAAELVSKIRMRKGLGKLRTFAELDESNA